MKKYFALCFVLFAFAKYSTASDSTSTTYCNFQFYEKIDSLLKVHFSNYDSFQEGVILTLIVEIDSIGNINEVETINYKGITDSLTLATVLNEFKSHKFPCIKSFINLSSDRIYNLSNKYFISVNFSTKALSRLRKALENR